MKKITGFNIFPTPSSNIEYPECDGIRGVAILLVFWFHYLIIFNVRSELDFFWNIPKIIAYSGAYGVQLFFVLSAYLLFFPQYCKIKKGDSPQPISQFVIRRFMRIAPLYYISIISLIWFVDVGISSHDKFKHTVTHLLFIHVFFPETAYSINNVTWSLGVEFLFYLFLPFFIFFLSLALKLKNIKIRNSIIFLIFFILLLCDTLISTQTSNVIYASIESFCVGSIASLINFRLFKLGPSFKKTLTILAPVVIFFIILVHYNVYIQALNSKILYHKAFVSGIWKISGLYALLLVIASQKDRILYPFLSFYPLRIIGLVSYEIYLIHLFLLQLLPKLSIFSVLKSPYHFINGVIIFTICLLLGAVLHTFISRPFIKISGFMIHRAPGQKAPGWMPLCFTSFCIAIIIPTILLIQ